MDGLVSLAAKLPGVAEMRTGVQYKKTAPSAGLYTPAQILGTVGEK